MLVMLLLGVLYGRLGGVLNPEEGRTPGCGGVLLRGGVRDSRAAIVSTIPRHKLPTHMIDHFVGTRKAPTVLMRGVIWRESRVWIPAVLDGILQRVDPPGMAAGHLDNVHVAEKDDHRRHQVRDRSHEPRVAGTAGPNHHTAVHGYHIADGPPAQEGRAAGGQSLQPDPQDHGAGPPQGAAGAVAQAVHYGVVAVQGDGS